MAIPSGPLDEVMFTQPEIVRHYIDNVGMPYMHENMLHYYISASPFFDWTSKNGIEIERSNTDNSHQALIHNRREFERHLATTSGVEYVLVEGENFEFDREGAPAGKGVWVVRKQERVKTAKVRGRDEVGTLGTYFIAGEQMYQAPSVHDVVNSRLLSASRAMNTLYQTAASLSRTTALTKSTASRTASPTRSRQASLAPPGEDTATQRSGSVEPSSSTFAAAPGSQADTDHIANSLLLKSMSSFIQNRTEYSDDNPLLGEPGNLTFSTSSKAVKKRKADEEAAALALLKQREARAAGRSAGASGSATPAASPFAAKAIVEAPAIMTEAKAGSKEGQKERKKGREEKIKRRKSRHGGVGTPAATPKSATSSAPTSAI